MYVSQYLQKFSWACLLVGSCLVWMAFQRSACNMNQFYKVVRLLCSRARRRASSRIILEDQHALVLHFCPIKAGWHPEHLVLLLGIVVCAFAPLFSTGAGCCFRGEQVRRVRADGCIPGNAFFRSFRV